MLDPHFFWTAIASAAAAQSWMLLSAPSPVRTRGLMTVAISAWFAALMLVLMCPTSVSFWPAIGVLCLAAMQTWMLNSLQAHKGTHLVMQLNAGAQLVHAAMQLTVLSGGTLTTFVLVTLMASALGSAMGSVLLKLLNQVQAWRAPESKSPVDGA